MLFSASGPVAAPRPRPQTPNRDAPACENGGVGRGLYPRRYAGRACRRHCDCRRHRAVPRRHAAFGGLAAGGAHQGPVLAASRKILRRRLRPARAAAIVEDPELGRRQSRRAPTDHVLHVQRPGFSLRQCVLSEGDNLCSERAGAARLGARPVEAAARRDRVRALQCRALARLDPELLLLHHQADEDRSAFR